MKHQKNAVSTGGNIGHSQHSSWSRIIRTWHRKFREVDCDPCLSLLRANCDWYLRTQTKVDGVRPFYLFLLFCFRRSSAMIGTPIGDRTKILEIYLLRDLWPKPGILFSLSSFDISGYNTVYPIMSYVLHSLLSQSSPIYYYSSLSYPPQFRFTDTHFSAVHQL